jgi:phosphohistidine phosphatase SixA/8-oxo-dGTP pyrophosphatase MutT (NUDIX family)
VAGDVAVVGEEGAPVLVSDVVRAAGGVILRRRGGVLETLLVHRPKYDDLTFPKGKALGPESDEDTAVREVEEETGVRGELGPELISTSYVDPQGRPKRVRYWLIRADGLASAFEPDHEVDRVVWLDVGDASRALTYERDRAVLDAATGLAEPVYLVRHAKAWSKEQWRHGDDLRPLTTKGARQAEGLVAVFAERPLAAILSSPTVRCVRTVEPLARQRGLEVRTVEWLAPDTPASVARAAVRSQPGPAVLCSHREVIPDLVRGLADEGMPLEGPPAWKKGSTWAIERDEGFPSRGRYVPPPRDRASRED